MSTITLEDLRRLGAKLQDFLRESKTNERKVFLSEEELEKVNGILEPLFMTNLGDAVLVHYGAPGDWTRALFIPTDNFSGEDFEDQYSPVDEALAWFFL